MSEYLESEFLARISQRDRTFLTQTAVLERMCGPLCEAELELPGAGVILADLARSNLLLVPLDRREEWYRYHHLFRDMLLAELHRQAPGLMPVLRRRAASWCLQNDLAEEALQYSIAAGDVDTAAGLVEQLAVLAYRQGRVTTVQRWFQWLEERRGIEGHPMVAVLAALLSALVARPARRRTVGRCGRSLAVRGHRRAPMTPPPRRGPPWSGPCCAGTGQSGCAPTPTRPCAGSPPRAS